MKLLFTLMVALLVEGAPAPAGERWVIQKNSHLSIEGKSNVNSFRCEITEYLRPDTIYFLRDEQNPNVISLRGGIFIHINRFDCHQQYITKDLRKTLKADEQPLLKIGLLNIGNYTANSGKAKGWVNIELAGVSRTVEIDYQVVNSNHEILELNGSQIVKFSDFGLTPPHKLAGLIKVEEALKVRFRLVLKYVRAEQEIINIK